jgi:alcohol dehydrogenase (cytochrome c)
MDPKQGKQANNRGAALWGNLVVSPANWPARIVATDKETGKVVWETNVSFGEAQLRITAAPLAIKDKIIIGRRAAIPACATGSRRSTPRPAR